MTKLEYCKEWLRQRNVAFGFGDKATIDNWPGKGNNESRDDEVVHFVAKVDGFHYGCYNVKTNKKKEIMLCLVYDKHASADVKCVKTLKIDKVFELIDYGYFGSVKTLKLDLCNVRYVIKREKYNRDTNHYIHVLIANELRLTHLVEYRDETLKIVDDKNTIFQFKNIVEVEMKNLQYYPSHVKCIYRKYSTVVNTLTKDDIGFYELGVSDNSIIYSFTNGMFCREKNLSERNFFEENVFIEMCRMNNIKAVNINSLSKKEQAKITSCNVLNSVNSMDLLMYLNVDSLYYSITSNKLDIYIVDRSKVSKYSVVLLDKVKIKQSKAKLVTAGVKESKAVVEKNRSDFIDYYKRMSAMNAVGSDGTVKLALEDYDGEKYDVSYSYDSKHDLLVLESMKTDKSELRIPSVFDAVKPFFKENLRRLDLNNVQYIVERASGFRKLENLEWIKGEKLKFTHMVNLSTEEMSMKNRSMDRYLGYARKADLEDYYYGMAYLMANNLLYYVNDDCSVYFPSLDFFMYEYTYSSGYKEYDFIHNIKKSEIGYNSQKKYLDFLNKCKRR